jgi:hypothetical protein
MSSEQHTPTLRKNPDLTLTIGGAEAACAEYASELGLAPGFMLDVQNEIDRRGLPAEVIPFPLATGHTTRTLAEFADPDTRIALNQLPATDVDQGMGQYRKVGEIAMAIDVAEGAFGRYLDNSLIPQLSGRRPALNHVHVAGKYGLAGGTGSEGGRVALCATSRTILRKTSATVHLLFDLLGQHTTRSQASRGGKNCAVGIVDHLALAIAPGEPRRTCSMTFRELPDVGIDRDERDRLVIEAEQALYAADVQAQLMPIAPNRGLDGRYGNCQIAETHFFRRLDARTEVAPDVAAPLAAEVAALIETRREPRIESITVHADLTPKSRETSPSLADRTPYSDPEEIFEAVLQPCGVFSVSVGARLLDGAAIRLDDPATEFGAPPESPIATSERLGLQLDCLFHLENQLADFQAELEEVTEQGPNLARRLDRDIRTAQGRLSLNPLTIVRTLFSDAEKRLTRLQETIEQVRRNDDRRRELESTIAALLKTHAALKAEYSWLIAKLGRMERSLAAFVPRRRRFVEPLVQPHGLERVFGDLWEADGRADEAKMTALLTRAVKYVTVPGLARIVGANEGRLEQIAERLLNPRYTMEGPAWAGIERQDSPLKFHVLPPVEPEVGNELRRMVQAQDAKRFVAVSDRAPASHTAVDLHFYPVRTPADLLGGIYAAELFDAVHDPYSALYGVDLEKLKQLGITIGPDGILFDNPSQE